MIPALHTDLKDLLIPILNSINSEESAKKKKKQLNGWTSPNIQDIIN
jgi:hypothetical protein